MRLVIGYDGSAPADGAIDELGRAGLPPRDVEVLVLSVADVWPPLPASTAAAPDAATQGALRASPILRNAHELMRHALQEAKTAAAAGKQRVLERFPGWQVQEDSCGGSPAGAIIARAEQQQADLVVVGSHGRSALGRAFLGSVSHQVLLHAACSVRIGRATQHAASEPVRIVLGIDGSTSAATAVSAVSMRHWPAGTTVHVVAALDQRIATALAYASPPAIAFSAPLAAQDQDDRAWAQQAVESVARELRDAGLTAIPTVREGDPRRILLEEANSCAADCIFVGAKGMSRVERFLLGSVSTAVAERATCSVEVVRFPVS